MKAKELIRILQGLEPDTDVVFELGRDDEYRKQCAKAELATESCLKFLAADKVEIFLDSEDAAALFNIILKQANLIDLDEYAKEYDEQIKKKD